MNYKTYRTMNPEQQKEWEFKYKEPIHLNLSSVPGWSFGILLMATLYLMTSYLFFIDPKFEQYQHLVIDIMKGIIKITTSVAYILVFLALLDLYTIITRTVGEKRWLKRNNIKDQMTWKEKLKDTFGG
jgi:hypothetical protein